MTKAVLLLAIIALAGCSTQPVEKDGPDQSRQAEKRHKPLRG